MNLEDKRWFALLSCFFVGSVTGMQYAFSVYSDALKDKYDLKQSEVRNPTSFVKTFSSIPTTTTTARYDSDTVLHWRFLLVSSGYCER